MSLNSVVNNLVRAAAGIPADISDKDLDQHVAGLLAKEAKEREMKWSEIGLGGLLGSASSDRGTPDPNAPKPNKRFLASVIRTVDTHNSSVIRQQLEAAETARSNSGLGESSRSAASRMFGGAMRDVGRSSTKGKHRDIRSDDRRSYDSRERDRDRDRGRRDRDRSAERWHDKRQASRERRTRYDVDEEEEMFNAGVDKMAERKVKRDWLKRKEERDKRRKAREEAGEDEESERRRRDLYGDEDEESKRSGSRRDQGEQDRDDERSPRKSRRRDESDEEEITEERTRRRHRDSRSPAPKSPDRVSSRRRKNEKDDPEARRRSSSPRDCSSRSSKRNRDHDNDDSRTNGRSTDKSPPSKSSRTRSRRHSQSPPSRRSEKPSRSSRAEVSPSPSPGPSAPPPPADLAPPPPDSPPPPPPPAPASKMDKYFQSDYDPRLDLGEVPSTGYVPEVGWDNMLAILKERGKKPRNRSPGLHDDPLEIPKVRLRRTPSPTLKEIEKAERRAKRAARGFDDDYETEAERSKRKAERKKEKEERARVTELGPGDGGGLFDVSYVKKGGVREWDVGK